MELNNKEYTNNLIVSSKEAAKIYCVRIFGFFLAFLLQGSLARLLGADVYGVYATCISIVIIASIVGKLGIDIGIVKFLGIYFGQGEFEKSKGLIWGSLRITFISLLVVSSIIYLFRNQISEELFSETRLGGVIPFLCILIVLHGLLTIFLGIYRGLKKASIYYIYEEAVLRILVLFFFIISYFLGLRLYGIVFATLLAYFCVVVLLTFELKKNASFVFDYQIKPLKIDDQVIKSSLSFLIAGVGIFLLGPVNNLIIATFSTSAAVGIYSISMAIVRLNTLFYMAFNSSFAPLIAQYYAVGDMRNLERTYKTLTRFVTFLTIPISLTIVFFGQEVLSVFGKDFGKGYWVLFFLTLGHFFNSITGPCQTILRMTKYEKYELTNTIFVAAVNITLSIVLIQKIGMVGAAIGTSFALVVANIIRIVLVYLKFKIWPYDTNFFKIFPGTILSFILLYFAKQFVHGNIFLVLLVGIINFIFFQFIYFKLHSGGEEKLFFQKILKKMKI